jgi:hypothetical protein
MRNIDAQLLHHPYGLRTDSTRLRPGARDFKPISGVMPEKTFGHLTTG